MSVVGARADIQDLAENGNDVEGAAFEQALDHLEAEALREYANRVAHILDVYDDLMSRAELIEARHT